MIQKFLDKTEPELNTGCLLWAGACNKDGHGICSFYVHPVAAHRVAWRLFVGPIPLGLSILHRCDTPACVNTDHLFIGTQADNVADMVAKNRQARVSGAERHNAKLTWDQIEIIRNAEALSQYELAKVFGVNQSSISRIKSNSTYRRV